jgi:hypothetical protein
MLIGALCVTFPFFVSVSTLAGTDWPDVFVPITTNALAIGFGVVVTAPVLIVLEGAVHDRLVLAHRHMPYSKARRMLRRVPMMREGEASRQRQSERERIDMRIAILGSSIILGNALRVARRTPGDPASAALLADEEAAFERIVTAAAEVDALQRRTEAKAQIVQELIAEIEGLQTLGNEELEQYRQWFAEEAG